MTYTKTHKVILAFTLLYTAFFTLYYLNTGNFEFLAYVVLVLALTGLFFYVQPYAKFPSYLLAGLSLWGLLHMMGGSVITPDGVLYAWRMYPFFDAGGDFYILKFDQLVHGYLYAVVALVFHHLLTQLYGLRKHGLLIGFIAVMAALGVSAVNEIIEFIAVLTVPDNGVGGYYNTALDIVFNFAGALIAVIGFTIAQKLKRSG